MSPVEIPRIPACLAVAAVSALLATGCAQYKFEGESAFATAVEASRETINRLDQMPVGDLRKLAFSKKLQGQWRKREDRVFAGTPYLGARIRHLTPGGSSSSHRLSSNPGTFVSVGRGRPAFRGRLGRGRVSTDNYSGPSYVYHLRERWAELMVHIAAGQSDPARR